MTSISESIGLTGVVLYSLVFAIAIQRVFVHLIPYKPPFYSTRKLFHIALALYGLLQALSFISFLRGEENYEKWTYCVHLFGIFCEVCAFSLVSILWSKTLMSRNNAKKCVIPFLLFVDSIFLFYIIYLVIDMSLTPGDFVTWTQDSFIFDEILIVEPLILAINGLCISYLGIRITQRLTQHPSWNLLASTQKTSILFRLIGTMVICCVSFLMRAIFEIILYLNGAKDIPYIEWWIFSTWIPTITPALILMYTMRRTESRQGLSGKESSNKWQSTSDKFDSRSLFSSPSKDSRVRRFEGVNEELESNDRLIFSTVDNDDSEDEYEDILHTNNTTPLLEGDNSNNNNSSSNNNNQTSSAMNKGGVDFFRGAPDLRPSFYRNSSCNE